MATYVRKFRCKKCGTKFEAFVPKNAKWTPCANVNCNNMIKIKDH